MHLCMTVHMHTEIQTRFIITLKENTYDEMPTKKKVAFYMHTTKVKKKKIQQYEDRLRFSILIHRCYNHLNIVGSFQLCFFYFLL